MDGAHTEFLRFGLNIPKTERFLLCLALFVGLVFIRHALCRKKGKLTAACVPNMWFGAVMMIDECSSHKENR